MSDYSAFPSLKVEVADGIAWITIPDLGTSARARANVHHDVSLIWPVIGDDPDVRVAVITGTGAEFYHSGEPRGLRGVQRFDKEALFGVVQRVQKEAQDIVYNMINLDKPIISAINGKATGAGLAVALMADIPIAAEDAEIVDPHIALGIAAGDHAAINWPILCGMAQAKRYLLTSDPLDGREAERIGLVSLAVPGDQLEATARAYATKLAEGPQYAIRFTKRALNQWLRLGGVVAFDYSLALEMLGFCGPEMGEAIEATLAGRKPNF